VDEIRELQDWYLSRCDGEWEHRYGINIASLDNPGWAVDIALTGTPFEGVPFTEITRTSSEWEWLRCWVDEKGWHGAGGPLMLTRLLRHFLEWVRTVRPVA
jgi:hypothetical protein